jgi:hypothetical protein
MPIFQDPDHERLYGSWSIEQNNYGQNREPATVMMDTKRMEPEDTDMMEIFEADENLDHPQNDGRLQTGDREALISEIKRKQVPTWKGQSVSASSEFSFLSFLSLFLFFFFIPKSGWLGQ